MGGAHGRHLSQRQISILVQMPDSNKIQSATIASLSPLIKNSHVCTGINNSKVYFQSVATLPTPYPPR